MLNQVDSQFGSFFAFPISYDDDRLGPWRVSLAEGLGRVRTVTYRKCV